MKDGALLRVEIKWDVVLEPVRKLGMHFDLVTVVPVQIRGRMCGKDEPLKLAAALLQLGLWIFPPLLVNTGPSGLRIVRSGSA
jgi:hypothetical protein